MLLKYIAPGMSFAGEATSNPLELVIAMQAQKETQKANEYLKQIKVPWAEDICRCYEQSPFFMGKSTIKWPCSIAMLNYQRVHASLMELQKSPAKICWEMPRLILYL
jgi:hypothetical protein